MGKPIANAPFQCVVNVGMKIFNFNTTYWTVCELFSGYIRYNPVFTWENVGNAVPVQGLTSQFRVPSSNLTGNSFLVIAPSSEIEGYPRSVTPDTGDDSPFVKVHVDSPTF